MEGKTRGATTRDGGNTWDETGWTYDPASGLNTAKRYADGSQIAYAYTDNGKKTRTTWARGVWKENAYDSDNRVSGVTYSDGTPTVGFAYSQAGKFAEAVTAGGPQYSYGYDSRLLCTNETFGIGSESFDVVRSYDDRDRCDSFAVIVTNVAHAIKTRRFDAEGRVAGYNFTNGVGRGVSVSLQYDGTRLVNTVFTLPNGGTFSMALTRNAARPDLVNRRAYSENGSSVYWYENEYDLMGRPTNANDSVSLARAYLYSRRNELAEALVGTNAFAYAYDSIGNRTVTSANSVTNTYAANSLNQYTTINRTIEQAEQSNNFSYDIDGNLTRGDRFVYAYDAENCLVSVHPISPTEGALAVINAYDHDNRRVVKRVERFHADAWTFAEAHLFVYDDNNIVLERIVFADGSFRTVEYFWGNDLSGSEQGAGGVGGLLAVSIDGSFYFPCYDQIGNVVCYVSEAGVIVAQYVYDPYGNVIEQYGTLADSFDVRFSTRYTDRETGLIAYKRRFYRPDHGRWISRDPIEEDGGENLYAFCLNVPVLAIDKYGCLSLAEQMQIMHDLTSGVVADYALAYTELSGVVKTQCKCNGKGSWELDETDVLVVVTVHYQSDGYENAPGAALFAYRSEYDHLRDIRRGVKDLIRPTLMTQEMILKQNQFRSETECTSETWRVISGVFSSLARKISLDSKAAHDDTGDHTWRGGP